MKQDNIKYLIPESVCAGIYKIITPGDRYYYIGSAKNLKTRFNRHKWELRNNRHHNICMQNIYNKYIDGVWRMELLESVIDIALLPVQENLYIKEHYGKPGCINASMSAYRPFLPFGMKRTDETKKRMSLAQIGKPKPWKKNVPHTDTAKAKISKANIGKKLSAETKIKMSISKRKTIAFYHKLHGLHITYAKGLVELYPDLKLDKTALGCVIKGRYKQHKGWTVLKDAVNLNIVSETQT